MGVARAGRSNPPSPCPRPSTPHASPGDTGKPTPSHANTSLPQGTHRPGAAKPTRASAAEPVTSALEDQRGSPSRGPTSDEQNEQHLHLTVIVASRGRGGVGPGALEAGRRWPTTPSVVVVPRLSPNLLGHTGHQACQSGEETQQAPATGSIHRCIPLRSAGQQSNCGEGAGRSNPPSPYACLDPRRHWLSASRRSLQAAHPCRATIGPLITGM